jgi:hypothetical protein
MSKQLENKKQGAVKKQEKQQARELARCTWVTRKEFEKTHGIGLNAFGAYLGGGSVDQSEIEFVSKYGFALNGEFNSANGRTEQGVFITSTVSEQARRGCCGGICEIVRGIEIDTNDGKAKRDVLRYFDDSKCEGGIITTKLLAGLRLYNLTWLKDVTEKNKLVQVKVINRTEGKDGRPVETLYTGVAVGSLGEKWFVLVYHDGSGLNVLNCNTSYVSALESKVSDLTIILKSDFDASDIASARATLRDGVSKPLRLGKKAKQLHAANTVAVVQAAIKG